MKSLFQDWTNALKSLQINSPIESLNGGILCPACSRVHGRSIDAIYPFIKAYIDTGDHSYYASAKNLYSWTNGLKNPDGSWNNDLHIVDWNGISVFNLISVLSTIEDFGDSIENEDLQEWMSDYRKTADFVYDTFTISTGNINYPASATYALFLAYRVFGDTKFLDKANTLATELFAYFTEEGILFGEGYPQLSVSKKGCRPIDIAYNLDESLPHLLKFAEETSNILLLELIKKSYEAHSYFILEDGGIDNSWCARNYKWTYYGSRTSDGPILGLMIMGQYDSKYHKLNQKHIELLTAATRNGILDGGLGYGEANTPPCIHHTFCHAKNIAMSLEYAKKHKLFTENQNFDSTMMVPDEFSEFSPNMTNISIVNAEKWRFTISDYDWQYAPGSTASGGALTLLRHSDFGIIIAAGLNYHVMPERFNMQSYPPNTFISATPKLEAIVNNKKYQSIDCLDAKIQKEVSSNIYIYQADGYFQNQIEGTELHELKYSINYTVSGDARKNIVIKTVVLGETQATLKYILPIVHLQGDTIEYKNNSMKITRNGIILTIIIHGGILEKNTTGFNYQPGFVFTALGIELIQGSECSITLEVSK
ncbi:hypothetical protein HOO68_06465 [Candidatus Gracilibacteria bacterium]|nr:hypothetical protein [Candidatus Gracilibacteria bacterium]